MDFLWHQHVCIANNMRKFEFKKKDQEIRNISYLSLSVWATITDQMAAITTVADWYLQWAFGASIPLKLITKLC